MNARHGLWWWVAASLLSGAGPALAQGEAVALAPPLATLQAASLAPCEGGIALLLEADVDLTYKVFRLEHPPRLVIDLVGLRAPLAVTVPPGVDGVRAVRYSLWKPDATEPIVRYVLESDAPLDYQVQDNGPVVTILAALTPAAEQAAPTNVAMASSSSVPPETEGPPMPAAEAENSLAPPPMAVSFGLAELIQLAEARLATEVPFAPSPTGQDGCAELWGDAIILRPSEGALAAPATDPAPAVAPAAPVMAEAAPVAAPPVAPEPSTEEPVVPEAAPAAAPAGAGELVASAESSVGFSETPQVAESAYVAATGGLAASQSAAGGEAEAPMAVAEAEAETPMAIAEAESEAETPMAIAEAESEAETPMAGERVPAPARSALRDRFDEIIARHRAAAELRAHRDWSQNLSPHDNAPLLGDADADFPLAGSTQAAPMSLDVQGADIHTVLRSLAEYAGVNIVADKDVAGRVTLRALDLPWPEMLRAVCRSMGLVAIDHGLVIRVATERVAQEEAVARESAARKQEDYMPLQTRIVPLRYAQASELKDLISTMRGTRGQVEVDPRTNAMILTDIGPRLDLLEQTLHSLDSQTMQVEITAEIVDVDLTEARALGITWGVDNYHSASANASGNLGIEASDVADPAGTAEIGFLRSFGEVHARIEALANDNKADIISTPRITTVNNREARILVGKEVPLITMDEAGNAITELKKVGITLQVTPYVNSQDQITLDLHPEVSDLSSQSTVQGGVVFTTTQADARVMVREGETAVIGGLIRTLEGKLERGVPLIKDVPVVGQLFKHREDRQEKRELLIFVTPRLVRASVDTGGQG